ncbi:hypothetical protein H8E06_00395 [bacterium]|nr:hypothetical protein [bacterium]
MPLLPKFDKFEDLFSDMLSEAPIGDWNPDVRVSASDVSPKHYYFQPLLKKMNIPEEEWGDKLQDLTDAVVDEIGKHLDAEGEWEGTRKDFVTSVAGPAVWKVAQRFMTGSEDVGDTPYKLSNVASWNARVIVAAALKAGKIAEKQKASGKVVVKVDNNDDDVSDAILQNMDDPTIQREIGKEIKNGEETRPSVTSSPRGFRVDPKATYELSDSYDLRSITDADAKEMLNHAAFIDAGEALTGAALANRLEKFMNWRSGKVNSALKTLLAAHVIKLAEKDRGDDQDSVVDVGDEVDDERYAASDYASQHFGDLGGSDMSDY